MNDLVYLVPTRGRPANVARLIEAFAEHSRASTTVYFVVDRGDPTRHEVVELVKSYRYDEVGIIEYYDGIRGQVAPLNFASSVILAIHEPFALGVMGDDHVPNTTGWDQLYLDAIEDGGWVHGNDMIQGDKLATEVVLTSNIVKTLGWFTYPKLRHLYCDNVWTDLGRETGRLTYLPTVIVEHLHYSVGKSSDDDTYRFANSGVRWSEDGEVYQHWRDSQMKHDVAQLKEKLGW